MQWNPEHQVGFGYVTADHKLLDDNATRGKMLQTAVINCVKG